MYLPINSIEKQYLTIRCKFLYLHLTMVMLESCNVIRGALYEALEQLHVYQVTRPSPAGVRGWPRKTNFELALEILKLLNA